MSTARRCIVLGAVVLALLAANGCFDSTDPSAPLPQQLTDLCKNNACDTTGTARRTTGLTSDTIGFQLGPGAGSVLIPTAPGGLDVLVRGHGKFSVELLGGSTVKHDIPSGYSWIYVDDQDGGDQDIRFSVADDGSALHIADLRSTGTAHCSVAPAGPR